MAVKIGDKFERLTVHAYSHAASDTGGSVRHYWICQCQCGKLTRPIVSNDLGRSSLSCGCLRKEQTGKNFRRNPADQIGRTYGVWEVKELVGKKIYPNLKSEFYQFRCECKLCKTTKLVISSNLRVLNGCRCQRPVKMRLLKLTRLVSTEETSTLPSVPVAPKSAQKPVALTDRQQQVLELMWQGLGTKRIAAALNIRVDTAKEHRAAIIRKGFWKTV